MRVVSDEELEQAFRRFRSSVREWSETEYARPRKLAPAAGSWRRARGFAFGGAMASLAAACLIPLTIHRGQAGTQAVAHAGPVETTAVAAAGKAAQQDEVAAAPQTLKRELLAGKLRRAWSEQKANSDGANDGANQDDDDALMASIDNEIARGTPRALAPLANLMGDSAEK